ncbi:MAG TPA: PIN domain-containing protein [Myxococcota bacterium]|nr:PIN domain-containing protein [Myxococcota bacterium]
MSRVFWDTNLFIYLFEGRGPLCERVVALRQRMIERGDELFTSALSLGEILVKPLGAGNEELANQYRSAIARAALVIPFAEDASPVYARIRGDRSIRAPDAIQLACASTVGIDLFITNDERLSRKSVPGIQFVASLERAFL